MEGDVLDKKVPSTGGTGRGMFTGLGLLFMGTAAQQGREKEACRSDTEIDVEGRNPR